MEQIKINDEVFSITEIMPVTPNVIRIVFCDKVPIKWGEITTWSIGGVKEGEKGGVIVGYETVYRDEGQTIYLSNDGSVYVAPGNRPNHMCRRWMNCRQLSAGK